jgi:hypothetical protein
MPFMGRLTCRTWEVKPRNNDATGQKIHRSGSILRTRVPLRTNSKFPTLPRAFMGWLLGQVSHRTPPWVNKLHAPRSALHSSLSALQVGLSLPPLRSPHCNDFGPFLPLRPGAGQCQKMSMCMGDPYPDRNFSQKATKPAKRCELVKLRALRSPSTSRFYRPAPSMPTDRSN